jgi:hypothetical protein
LAEKESWNWLKYCDRKIAAEGIPEGFRLAKPGRVVLGGGEQRQANARSNQRFVNSFLCWNLFFAERQSYVHICWFNK